MTRSREIGTRFETWVVDGFRKAGFKDVERLRQSGALDEGDVVVKDLGHTYILECKAVKSIDMASFLKQATDEAENYRKRRDLPEGSVTGIAVIKRRNKGVWESYVVSDLRTFFDVDPS